MNLYRKILHQSWNITWRHKYLWFCGLFVALFSGDNDYRILMQAINDSSGQNFFTLIRDFVVIGGGKNGNFFANLYSVAVNSTVDFIMVSLVFVIILALALFVVWVSIISLITIIRNAALNINGEDADFKTGLMFSLKKFFPVFFLEIFKKALFLLATFILSIPFLFGPLFYNSSIMIAFYIMLFTVVMLAAIIVSFIFKYAMVFVVIKGEKTITALKSGWKLFIANWLVSAETAVILFGIGVVAAILLFLFTLVISVPFIFVATLMIKLWGFLPAIVFVVFGALAYLVFIALFGGILNAFQVVSWTNLFVRLLDKGGTSKIIRMVDDFKRRRALAIEK